MEDTPTTAPTKEKQVELTFIAWLAKVNERIAIALLSMKDKQDRIQESDYTILEALHRNWFFGETPIFQTIIIPDRHKAVDQSLFPDTLAEEATIDPNGTVIDSILSEQLNS